MGAINKEWHDQHKMPANATPMQRLGWHEAHQKYCACRPIPPSVLKLMPPSSDQT
jgi:hypothetical protein